VIGQIDAMASVESFGLIKKTLQYIFLDNTNRFSPCTSQLSKVSMGSKYNTK